MTEAIDFSYFDHCISTMPLFQSLTLEQVQLIQERIQEKTYLDGELLYQAGEQTNALNLIQHGQVRVYRLASSGKEQHIRILEAGDFIGELALFNDRRYDRYVEAIGSITVCSIQRDDFKQILMNHPSIAIELLGELSDRLDHSEQQTTWITSESVQARLAAYLLEESVKQHTVCITLASTKKNIASYLGMSPESFSRGLTKLTKLGSVKQPAPNKIELLNLNALEQIASQ